LSGVKLDFASLHKTNFSDADLTTTDFGSAKLTTAIFCRTKVPWGIENSGCK